MKKVLILLLILIPSLLAARPAAGFSLAAGTNESIYLTEGEINPYRHSASTSLRGFLIDGSAVRSGLFTGFSATMLIEAFGIKGVYYTALTLLPSGILHTVLFSFLGTLSIQEGIQVIQAFRCRRGVRGRNNKNAGRQGSNTAQTV